MDCVFPAVWELTFVELIIVKKNSRYIAAEKVCYLQRIVIIFVVFCCCLPFMSLT